MGAVISSVSPGSIRISTANKKSTSINTLNRIRVSPRSILPFRVSFINVETTSYSANNPAPIGIAIIGVNNYIL